MVSAETRRKASDSCKNSGCGSWRRGQKLSESWKANISKATKGERNPFFGKEHSETTRQKMRDNHADFTGDKNPLRRAIERDPSIRRTLSRNQKKTWDDIKADPGRYAEVTSKMSKSMAEAHAAGRLSGYGRGHQQGWFDSSVSGEGIFYRSSYERKFLDWCINRRLTVESCPFVVPYTSSDGRQRHYVPDFVVDGTCVVEVKPVSMLEHRDNPAKFKSACSFVSSRRQTFHVVTEEFFRGIRDELPDPWTL